MTTQAIFGGGCFWCTEAVFRMLKGVIDVRPGYAGGVVPHPTYEMVSSGTTGHAEVVIVPYDPSVITYRDLLAVFFTAHDPTTLNRQGADVGTQYRSVIFTTNAQDEADAHAYITALTERHAYADPIVTTVSPISSFWEAEDYHARYYEAHPDVGYCRIVITPKLEHIRETHTSLVQSSLPLA